MTLRNSSLKKALIIFLLSCLALCFAQEKYNVYFYGVITPQSQENQRNITLDLFTAQIRVNFDVNLVDRRNTGFYENYVALSDKEASELNGENIFSIVPKAEDIKDGDRSIVLVSKIEKTDDENWQCAVYTKNYYTSKIDISENQFDSFYKILTDSKLLIDNVLSASTNREISSTLPKRNVSQEPIRQISMTIEDISGTWSGEQGITKIIIMRSGRGFIIFNNGASMNISLSVDVDSTNKRTLKITQATPFNASYYPDIPRQDALKFAGTANPIQWTFSLSESGSLTGIKNSLAKDAAGNIGPSMQSVKWERIN